MESRSKVAVEGHTRWTTLVLPLCNRQRAEDYEIRRPVVEPRVPLTIVPDGEPCCRLYAPGLVESTRK